MRRTRLGSTRVEVTAAGFGGAPIGNLFATVSDDSARAAIDAAWDEGVRYFDTAPHYGLGLSERRLGRALAARPRNECTVSTKVGRVLEPVAAPPEGSDPAGFDIPATHRRVWDFSREGVRRSLESSLERLGMDHVEIALLHDPDDHWRQARDEAYPALEELRAGGAVGAIGVGMNQWQMPLDFVRGTDIDVVMLAGRYTLLEQPALDELLPACAEAGVSVLAAGVFNSGLLACAEPPDDATYNYRQAPRELIERARGIAQVCARAGTTLPAAALAFPFGHPAVASVVVGTRSAEESRDDAALLRTGVPPELWDELKAEGLLREDAPVPSGDPASLWPR
ncbi:MAG TPA: aldo/keto reductase [Egibacteraceae bacterium]|nr:aldo/keto reductase [Egibacteraceae bacterium]